MCESVKACLLDVVEEVSIPFLSERGWSCVLEERVTWQEGESTSDVMVLRQSDDRTGGLRR